ncbi:Hypothetical predicted protein [Mytilus galloprovincialis]|uniref:Uncharacterized protein n=1 Tax=Mytilus galloprovincialis TaxID=29158 RepID=A0A8B6CBJ3_MYTGA|nr:Hypothetical predicted protein [Mytilus galloprovincialis]
MIGSLWTIQRATLRNSENFRRINRQECCNDFYNQSPESLFELKQREPSPIDEALAETKEMLQVLGHLQSRNGCNAHQKKIGVKIDCVCERECKKIESWDEVKP